MVFGRQERVKLYNALRNIDYVTVMRQKLPLIPKIDLNITLSDSNREPIINIAVGDIKMQLSKVQALMLAAKLIEAALEADRVEWTAVYIE